MAGIRIEGDASGNVAEVTSAKQLKIVPETNPSGNPGNVGAMTMHSLNDNGQVSGTPRVSSPETSSDYRLRVGMDLMLDTEVFNYAAQNTSKHSYTAVTMANALSGGFLNINSAGITTLNTATRFFTQRMFVLPGQQTSLYAETLAALSAAPATNTTIDFGLFICGAGAPMAPTDGAYFRITNAGVYGVVNYNGTETGSAIFSFTPVVNRVYQFLVTVTNRNVEFWIDDVLYGEISTPVGQSQPFQSQSLPYAIRHSIGGTAAGSALSLKVAAYSVALGDSSASKDFETALCKSGQGAAQGQSGGTMGTTANYVNSADPAAAAALSNTTALVTGLGGQYRFNAGVTAVTDGIVTSFQVPAGTVAVPGRSLIVTGINLSAVNMGAAVATTASTIAWSLAFGHTAVSLATAETGSFVSGTAKAPRRVPLGFMTWPVGAGVGQGPQNGDIYIPFTSPIVVNPGEFIASVAKFIMGTATASQVIWGHVTIVGYFE